MIHKKIFYTEESPYYPGKYVVRVNHDDFHLTSTEGSYNLICARLLELDYADYLRMCRDCFGAEIIGKNSKYPVAYFKRSKELDGLVDLLNAAATMVLWMHDHPDYDEHAAYMEEHRPKLVEIIKKGRSEKN